MTLLQRDRENIELGREKERKDMAIGMLEENIDISKIMKITGFTEEELRQIQKEKIVT